jgi:hypothetical protein
MAGRLSPGGRAGNAVRRKQLKADEIERSRLAAPGKVNANEAALPEDAARPGAALPLKLRLISPSEISDWLPLLPVAIKVDTINSHASVISYHE